MFENLSIGHLIAVMVVFLLLFGAKRIPEIGASLGSGIKEFKRSLGDGLAEGVSSGVSSGVAAPLDAPRDRSIGDARSDTRNDARNDAVGPKRLM